MKARLLGTKGTKKNEPRGKPQILFLNDPKKWPKGRGVSPPPILVIICKD